MSNATTTPAHPAEAGVPTLDERTDLLSTLRKHRAFLRYTTRNLTDEQANLRTTVSELSLAGLLKHVTDVERGWARFILDGSGMQMPETEQEWEAWAENSRVQPGETLQVLLDRYAEVAGRTDEIVTGVRELGATRKLPEAPWFTEERWSMRRVVLHMIAETAQHAGHADIIRETFDGQKTMG